MQANTITSIPREPSDIKAYLRGLLEVNVGGGTWKHPICNNSGILRTGSNLLTLPRECAEIII